MRRPIAFLLMMAMAGSACGSDGGGATPTGATAATAPPLTTTTANMPRGEIFEVTYTGTGCTVAGPSEVETGEHSFILRDETGELEAVYAMRLDADKTRQDAIDDQPAPGRWHPKPPWMHYTSDLGSWLFDDGELFAIAMRIPGEHVLFASVYYSVPEDERVHWYCSPTFEVTESSG